MIHRHFLLATLIIAAAAPISAQDVKAGVDAWQRADYSAAVAIWRPLAEKGDADAAFNLGQAYRLGRGVPINLATAKSWFERAANKGHVDAETTLGLLLFENGDQPGGLKWLKAAAEQGEPRASLVYGTALFNGDSVAQNQVLGYAYVSRAAAQGLAPAKDMLAQLDKLISVEDRKKGVAIAMTKAEAAPAPSAKPVPALPAAKPVQTAGKSAAPAPVKPVTAASGAWRIQLGAFVQKGSAEALYQRLSNRTELAGRHAFFIPVGTITRLQVGPYESRAAAQTACNALKGQACFVVSAR